MSSALTTLTTTAARFARVPNGRISRRLRSGVGLFCAVVIAYAAGATLAFRLLGIADQGAVFFAPAGVTVAALLLVERRRWPIVIAAAALTEIAVDAHNGITGAASLVGFALANTVEPLVGALVATGGVRRIDLRRRVDLVRFISGAALVGPAFGAVIGAGTVALGGGPFSSMLFSWWLGDSLGVLVVGGLIVASATARRDDIVALTSIEGSGGLFIIASFGVFLHWITDLPVGFLVLIPLMAISARLGPFVGAVTTVVVVAIAVGSWFEQDRLVVGVDAATGIMIVKLQLWALATAAFAVAAESAAREAAMESELHQRRTSQVLRDALAAAPVIRANGVVGEGLSRSADRRLDVGGDWYDVVEMPSGRVAIVIGDVAGHGEAALITMGKLRFAAAALALQAETPGNLADQLDRYAQAAEHQPYATVFVAFFDPVTRQLAYASMGHPPALLGAPDGTWSWLQDARSTPAGLTAPGARPTATVQLDGPSTLVVYTDGVVERSGELIDDGLARLRDAMERDPGRPLGELFDAITGEGAADDASFVRIQLEC